MYCLGLQGSLQALLELLVHSNDLHLLPLSLDKLPQLKIDARDNLLGRPPTPPPLLPTPGEHTHVPRHPDDYIPRLYSLHRLFCFSLVLTRSIRNKDPRIASEF